MSHENTETIEMDGRHYIRSRVTGQILEGPFGTAQAAEARARQRSQEPVAGLEMSEPSYAGMRGMRGARAEPADSLAAQVFTPTPDFLPPLGDPEAIEPRAYGRQAGPGRSVGLLGFLQALREAYRNRERVAGPAVESIGFGGERPQRGTVAWPMPAPPTPVPPRGRVARGFGSEGWGDRG
jgi:hypothetical protein